MRDLAVDFEIETDFEFAFWSAPPLFDLHL